MPTNLPPIIAASLLASTSRNAGGLFESVRRLHQELQKVPNVSVPVFGLQDRYTLEDNPRWYPLEVHSSKVWGPSLFGFAPSLLDSLLAAGIDLLQVHGIWQYPSIAASGWHRKTKLPYIISPHGMLDPWAVGNSHWKKLLAHTAYEGKHLREAMCIRALCKSEEQSIRAYGLKNPVCVIPNGIDLPEKKLETRSKRAEKKILLFLGRLHPKKGLPNALRAWASYSKSEIQNSRFSEWQFVIAGWDQGGHEAELKRLCREIGVPEASISAEEFLSEHPPSGLRSAASVVFIGPAFGDTKDALLRQASAFILPSFSEGLPMSVLEAWSYGLPVLMTDFCNLPEGFAVDAAIRIGTDVASIADGMRNFLRSPTSDLRSLGSNGRALVERQFAWPQIATQMKEVYDWMLGGGDAPDCMKTS